MSARGRAQTIRMDGYDVAVTRKRVKNVNLRVRPDGSVAVSAPGRVPLAEIERFVRARAAWIDRQRRRAAARAGARHAWEDGERVGLWGEPLTLAFSFDAAPGHERAERLGDELRVHVAPRWEGAGEKERRHRARLVDRWLAGRLDEAARGLLGGCEERVGRRATALRYRRMTSRWGSCNVETGRITLNIELAERPPVCLEAVLCHELCHLHERRHNARFYALLDATCPSWRAAHALLAAAPPLG